MWYYSRKLELEMNTIQRTESRDTRPFFLSILCPKICYFGFPSYFSFSYFFLICTNIYSKQKCAIHVTQNSMSKAANFLAKHLIMLCVCYRVCVEYRYCYLSTSIPSNMFNDNNMCCMLT